MEDVVSSAVSETVVDVTLSADVSGLGFKVSSDSVFEFEVTAEEEVTVSVSGSDVTDESEASTGSDSVSL